MTSKQFAAVIGFAFVLTWITLGFADAVLCALAAALAATAFAAAAGELDLADLRDRLRTADDRRVP